MGLLNGQTIDQTDFINDATKDVNPALNVNKAIKLEADGKVHPTFLRESSVFTAPAAIALSASDPVGLTIEGKVAKAFRTLVAASGAIVADHKIIQVNTNKFACMYVDVPVTARYNLAVATYDPVADTVAFGTMVQDTGWRNGIDLIKIANDKVGILLTDNAASDGFIHIRTITGTTLSAATQTTLATGTFDAAWGCQLDNDRFAYVFSSTGGTANAQGVCTVSGTTASVLYSSTTVITNINVASAFYRLVALSATKHVICNGNTGFCVVIDSTSSYSAGTAFQPVSASTPLLIKTSLVSDSATSFYLRVGGGMRRCTVSGTTITNNGTGVSIPNDSAGDLCIFGGKVYEVHYNSTTAVLSGLYLIEHSTNLIRTQLCTIPFTGAPFIANLGSTFVAYQGSGTFFSSAMAANFAGFVKVAYAQAANAMVFPFGRVSGLSNLLPGSTYSVNNGQYVPDVAGGLLAISTTELVVR